MKCHSLRHHFLLKAIFTKKLLNFSNWPCECHHLLPPQHRPQWSRSQNHRRYLHLSTDSYFNSLNQSCYRSWSRPNFWTRSFATTDSNKFLAHSTTTAIKCDSLGLICSLIFREIREQIREQINPIESHPCCGYAQMDFTPEMHPRQF